MKIDVADATKNLLKLIKAVENGELVTICRDGVPTVDLVRATKAHKRRDPNLEP
jgi:antitoxin (DNA-binding transcriptional repressor) of toxin-antitoxin stability system